LVFKKSAENADFNVLISPRFRAVKIYTIREIRFVRLGNRREPGKGGGGEGSSPSQNPLLVAALGQLVANNIWTLVAIVSMNECNLQLQFELNLFIGY
jgi:hypothetical protein